MSFDTRPIKGISATRFRPARSAGLQTGIAPAAGETPVVISLHCAASNGDGVPPPTPTGWFCVVPGRVPAIGEHGGGSFAAFGRDARSAGLQTGIARAAGETPVVTSLHGAVSNGDGVPPPTPTGWFCVVPGRVPAIGEHGGGSFAAFGRDAGVKTGAPAPSGWRPATHTHWVVLRCPRTGSGNRRTWRWEFRGLWPRCRSEDRRSCPFWMASRHPHPLGGSALSPDGFRQSANMAEGVSRPAAAMPGAPVFRPASPAQRAKLPSSLRCMAQQATSMAQRHPRVRTAVRRPRTGSGNRRTWRREFRGLWPRCRSEDRRSCPFWMASRHPPPLGGSALSPDGFRQSANMAVGVSRPLAAMPV